MKRLLSIFAALLCVASAQDKPNIVFILSDDQGWTDYGFMGHDVIKTPHLDKLADRSLVFERGYVASPLCRPSLATMATGRWPFEHGITGNDVEGMKDRATRDVPMRDAFQEGFDKSKEGRDTTCLLPDFSGSELARLKREAAELLRD